MRAWLLLFPVLALAAGPAAYLFGAAPRDGQPVLVVAAPWSDVVGIVRAAGGAPVGPERAPMAILAIGGDRGCARLVSDGGAWFVLDGAPLPALCGVG